jgi:hypothetical protein
MKLLILVALTISSAFAQFDPSSSIDFDMPIQVDGTYSQQANGKKQLTPAQRLKLLRKKLEKRNELMVKRKIETLRYQQEVEMMKKIQSAFNKTMQNLDNIQ